MLEIVTDADVLTDAQLQFAGARRAHPVLRSGRDKRMVFMYRGDELATSRWLVDHAGRVVDSVVFPRSGV
jgi:hypothetical protein